MKPLATYKNGDFRLRQQPPKRAVLSISIWAIVDGETQRDTVKTPLVDVVEFLGGEGPRQLVENFMIDCGINDGDLVDGYGFEVYRWR